MYVAFEYMEYNYYNLLKCLFLLILASFSVVSWLQLIDFSPHWVILFFFLLCMSGDIFTGCCFCFGSISSFFLEFFLYWSPVAYRAPRDLGSSSFSVLSFCLFILFLGFSRQEYWSDLPFPFPVDHIFSELSIMTHLSWVALHGMTHSFTELDKLWSMWSD